MKSTWTTTIVIALVTGFIQFGFNQLNRAAEAAYWQKYVAGVEEKALAERSGK